MNLFLIETILNLDISTDVKERSLSFFKSFNSLLSINPQFISINCERGIEISFIKENEKLILFFQDEVKNDGWAYFKKNSNNDIIITIFNVLDNIDSCAEFIKYSESFI